LQGFDPLFPTLTESDAERVPGSALSLTPPRVSRGAGEEVAVAVGASTAAVEVSSRAVDASKAIGPILGVRCMRGCFALTVDRFASS